MEKQIIKRCDGITYERKVKDPTKFTKCLCIRIDDDRYEKIKKYGNVGTIIRDLIDIYFDTYIEKNLDNGDNNE